MASWGQLEFSDAVSPAMFDLIYFHDNVMLLLIFITITIMSVMFLSFFNKHISLDVGEYQSLEVIWTAVPSFFLIYIGAPSLYILYMMEYDYDFLQNMDGFCVKVTGNQWYWSYESFFLINKKTILVSSGFDSYMHSNSILPKGIFRLLDVDNRLIVPCQTFIKIFVTSSDVLHSWALPGAGIKVDACPGRLNQVTSLLSRPGIFYGQCSEICGANHSFMPIVVEARPLECLISSESILLN